MKLRPREIDRKGMLGIALVTKGEKTEEHNDEICPICLAKRNRNAYGWYCIICREQTTVRL